MAPVWECSAWLDDILGHSGITLGLQCERLGDRVQSFDGGFLDLEPAAAQRVLNRDFGSESQKRHKMSAF